MNSKLFMIIRFILAIGLLFFGANKIFHFMTPPPPPVDAMGYWQALTTSKTMLLVAIVEMAAGLSLLINKYAALMMIILMSVSLNAVLYHAAFDPNTILMAVVLLLFNILMLFAYKDKYKELLK